MNKKKIISSLIFLALLLVSTFYVIFSQNDFNTIVNTVSSIDYKYGLIALALVILYFLMQGIYMKMTLRTLDEKISLRKGVFYSIVEFFFSAITPSSTGGQPVQLYYMAKDDIPTEKSLIVLILNTIIFKLFIVVFGILVLIFLPELVFNSNIYILIVFMLGMIVDIIIVLAGYQLIFGKKMVKSLIGFYYKLVNKFTRKNVDYNEKIEQLSKKYSNNAEYIINHKKTVFIGTIITFVQRILLFSITYVVYLALGLSGISYFELLLLQIVTQVAIEGLPLPGGTGALEAIINSVYVTIFGEFTLVGALLVRSFAFYIPLIITMLIIMFVSKFKYNK